MTWLLVAVAGGCGAATRYLVDHLVSARLTGVFPLGTFLVNVSGSLLAGVVAGLVATRGVPVDLQTVVAGGFLGAYTTFSTAMYETARLLEDGATGIAVANLLVPLGASLAAAGAGWWLVAV
jgi:fluoride exporter